MRKFFRKIRGVLVVIAVVILAVVSYNLIQNPINKPVEDTTVDVNSVAKKVDKSAKSVANEVENGVKSAANQVEKGAKKIVSNVAKTAKKVTKQAKKDIAKTNANSSKITANSKAKSSKSKAKIVSKLALSDIPKFSGKSSIKVNKNKTFFTSKQKKKVKTFEKYAKLDSLGRCGVTFAEIDKSLMPTSNRGSIASVYPTGWHQAYYDFVDGKYVYNRCHLIGYQLTGENANAKNLITGTRYLNIEGMLPYENKVAKYVKKTNNHVLYRVTPMFKGKELVARGVEIEGYSVEDKGKGINFNVYCYNVQPKVSINYSTGYTKLKSGSSSNSSSSSSYSSSSTTSKTYIANKNTKVFHLLDCWCVGKMNEDNKVKSNNRSSLISEGYKACSYCKP